MNLINGDGDGTVVQISHHNFNHFFYDETMKLSLTDVRLHSWIKYNLQTSVSVFGATYKQLLDKRKPASQVSKKYRSDTSFVRWGLFENLNSLGYGVYM